MGVLAIRALDTIQASTFLPDKDRDDTYTVMSAIIIPSRNMNGNAMKVGTVVRWLPEG